MRRKNKVTFSLCTFGYPPEQSLERDHLGPGNDTGRNVELHAAISLVSADIYQMSILCV